MTDTTRRLPLAILVLICALGFPRASVYARPPVNTQEVEVLEAVDGDTLRIRAGNRYERLRISSIDCPEKGQPYWKSARNRTSELATGQSLQVTFSKVDQYGRQVGEIFLDSGKRLSEQLVEDGLCWWYEHYARDDRRLERLEHSARTEKRGLWRDPSPLPPWSFRQLERMGNRKTPSSSSRR